MLRNPGSVRFSAFLPPPDAVAQIAAVQAALRARLDAKLTWVAPDHFHVTVWFLYGNDGSSAAVEWGTRTLPPAFDIALAGLGQRRHRFGDGHRALFIPAIDSPELVSLQRRINSREGRPPRVTLARGRAALELPDIEFEPIRFRADRLVLMRSERGDGPATYTAEREWDLT